MSKRTNQTARAAMILAHGIKHQYPSFSAALKAAWAQIKQPCTDTDLSKKSQLSIDDVKTIALKNGFELNKWNDRFYLNIDGMSTIKLWYSEKTGKITFELPKKAQYATTQAQEAVEAVIGCWIVNRYSEKNNYIVLG